jgi:hypothetical protein
MSKKVTRCADQSSTFIRVTSAAVTLVVGVLVFDSILNAIPDFDFANNSNVIDPTGAVDVVESAFQLAPVAALVIIAGLILSQVAGFR